jgi:hypothetical protein
LIHLVFTGTAHRTRCAVPVKTLMKMIESDAWLSTGQPLGRLVNGKKRCSPIILFNRFYRSFLHRLRLAEANLRFHRVNRNTAAPSEAIRSVSHLVLAPDPKKPLFSQSLFLLFY